jgi:chemotaxis-related protein WspB
MAERVIETINKPENDFVDPGIKVDAAPYLGEMIADEQGMIRLVRVEYLLPESQQAYLLPQQED